MNTNIQSEKENNIDMDNVIKEFSIDSLKHDNLHERDSQILFDEPTHVYTILSDPGQKYTSVTTWNHHHFEEFNFFLNNNLESFLKDNKLIISYFKISNFRLEPMYVTYKQTLDLDFIFRKMKENGYDISADVLGYPESYYAPPSEALKEIQIIRGAAALQYGTQFGGLVNFVFKNPPKDMPIELTTRNTLGSNGLYTNFTSFAGASKQWDYFSFINIKKGDGFRPNSNFESFNFTCVPLFHIPVLLSKEQLVKSTNSKKT